MGADWLSEKISLMRMNWGVGAIGLEMVYEGVDVVDLFLIHCVDDKVYLQNVKGITKNFQERGDRKKFPRKRAPSSQARGPGFSAIDFVALCNYQVSG
jgi:hypothetical protein